MLEPRTVLVGDDAVHGITDHRRQRDVSSARLCAKTGHLLVGEEVSVRIMS